MSSLTDAPTEVVGQEVIAIDGKTSRRSGRKAGSPPLHMVSAFAARQRLVLGQVAVAEKSNEIVAIPRLLDMLAIEGAVVTIDAIGCQRDIAQAILDKKADDVLALKGNQGTLKADVDLFVAEQRAVDRGDATVSHHESVDGDHGRIETRTTTVIHNVERLRQRHAWPGLNSVIVIDSRREIGNALARETRLYITSLTLPAARLGAIVRSHWSAENSLHRVMDMVFRDDCRVQTNNAPANFHHPQAHRPQPHPKSSRQGLAPPQTQSRRMGRRLPRIHHHSMTTSPDCPGVGTYSHSHFVYNHERDLYTCSAEGKLRLSRRRFGFSRERVDPNRIMQYRASKFDCSACARKPQCSPNEPARKVLRSIHESARDMAGDLALTKGYATSRRQRKKIEMLSIHLNGILKLDRLRLRGPNGARNEFHLVAIAQNLRKLAKLLLAGQQAMAT